MNRTKRLARPLPVALFALLSAGPIGLIGLGAVFGGDWPVVALLVMAVLPVLIDRLLPYVAPDAEEGAEFPAEGALLLVLAVGHLILLPLVVRAVAGEVLGPGQKLALFLAAGLWFGQVAHPAAHELIHRPGHLQRALGTAIYVTLLFGHHASAHRLVHHRHVGSPRDPNSARAGEGFYRFALRAWLGSFRAGYRAETRLHGGSALKDGELHPYMVYIGGALLCLGFGAVLGGWAGMAAWAGLGGHATMQILLSDYVQHYGLRRRTRPGGKLEPVGPAHSWNAGEWFSAGVMLNAPRHSDHHSHPNRPYPALRLPPPETAPRLPWPLPFACLVALAPPLWRRLMAPHLARWNPPKPLS
jgi:alkane 1-monooxygenase